MTEWLKKVLTLGLIYVFRFIREIFGKKGAKR